ncbi:surface antigen protein [Nitrosospira sp. NpAV]|uniref:glycine zipper 2TM domain-containing protein n=1 Tax=Nitrosospira sp. NpAV TaxID=58133 RepID=UPI0005A12965|nr:surface antigen protein [Nitrosospira sp. NpAV]KIO49525.1 surface antigen protein [Nitrosospira sp. NpAV]
MSQPSNSNAWIRRLTIIALVMLLPACQTADTKRTGGLIGSIAGSIGGSYLGSYLGGGTAGRIAGAVAGGLAGYYVGANIGGYLGKEDEQKMAQASQTAFETGQPQTFSNPDSGLKGKAEVVPSTRTGQQDDDCKMIRQTIVLKDGKTVTEDVKSCKNPQ